MFLSLILFTVAFAEYKYSPTPNADLDAAQQSCRALSETVQWSVCSKNQLYAVVFGNAEYSLSEPRFMCQSGWLTDGTATGTVGWWNGDDDKCGGNRFGEWAPAEPAAHCCTDAVVEIIPAQCISFEGCGVDRILDENVRDSWCVNGECSDQFCCKNFVAADLYTFVQGTFDNGVDANNACTTNHPDQRLCTGKQVEGVTDDGVGESCEPGWYTTNTFGEPVEWDYLIATYVAETGSSCLRSSGPDALLGWRTFVPKDPETGLPYGGAHCCTESYHKSGYGEPGAEYDDPEGYCASQVYTTSVCTEGQLITIAETEDNNQCMAGYYIDSDGNGSCGYYTGEGVQEGECGITTPGWKYFCADFLHRGVHCCTSYVWEYTYTVPDVGVDTMPKAYADSTLTSGEGAAEYCVELGFDGLCTKEQHRWQASNNPTCLVGYVSWDGGYESGVWGTACNKGDDWLSAWQPANPVAHCCNDDVPTIEIVTTVFPLLMLDKYTYQEFGEVEAAGGCDAAKGYSLCTRDQVEYVARFGVEDSDGNLQLEDGMCFPGFMADGSKGFYQTTVTTCGDTLGWRPFYGPAGYFCCQPFEATLAIDPYVKAGGAYTYNNEEEAQAACLEIDSNYILCTDNEVRSIALYGVDVPEDNTKYNSMDPQSDICHPGFVDSANSGTWDWGWYQIDEGCGGVVGGWNRFMWLQDSRPSAGAHCCASGLFDEIEIFYPDTDTPTENPTPAPVPATAQPTASTAEPTKDPTKLPTSQPTKNPTDQPTVFVPYSDLPSTTNEPEGCVPKLALTPEGFEGIIFYCASDGVLYLNGRSTCILEDDENAAAAIADSFNNDWYLSGSECSSKTYEEARDDQLFITNEMLNNLEEDIEQLEADMSAKPSDVESFTIQWKQEVADIILGSLSKFDETTKTSLTQFVEDNLSN